MSRAIAEAPTTAPSSLRIGLTHSETCSRRPSRCSRTVSKILTVSPRATRARISGISSSVSLEVSIVMCRPMASEACQPYSCSAPWFQKVISPSRFLQMIASWAPWMTPTSQLLSSWGMGAGRSGTRRGWAGTAPAGAGGAAHGSEQAVPVEGLGDVVGDPGPPGGALVALVGAGGQHHDGDVARRRGRAEPAHHLDTVEVGQHVVEQDHRGVLTQGHLEGRLAGGGLEHPEPRGLQLQRAHQGDVRVVVHHENDMSVHGDNPLCSHVPPSVPLRVPSRAAAPP